jgi:hypothetical protein
VIRLRDLHLITHNSHKIQTSIPSVGLETPIPASERTQTLALDIPATGMGFSVIYSLYLTIRSTKLLLEKYSKAQGSVNKISNFYIYVTEHKKKNFKFHTQCVVTRDIMCVILKINRFTNNPIPRNVSIFIHPLRFYAWPTCIHMAIPHFSPKILV